MTCITPRGHRRHALQLAALLALPLAQAQAQVPAVPEHALAEASLRAGWSGHELNLQIEAVEGPAAATQPRQGVIVRRYLSAQQWSATGVGGPNHQTSSGSYRLRPAGSYPSAGLVLQSYAVDGTLSFQGFGPGNLNSKGTYRYRKVSANTAVEETVQTSDFFTLPYTMVYTFRTPSSGSWYQDFGNGLIRFNGTFDTFPR